MMMTWPIRNHFGHWDHAHNTSANDLAVFFLLIKFDLDQASAIINKGFNVLWIDGHFNVYIQSVIDWMSVCSMNVKRLNEEENGEFH